MTTYGNDTSRQIKQICFDSLNADKAIDIVCVDLTEQNSIADTIYICSGTSSRHVAALAEKLKARLHIKGHKDIRIEGLEQGDWVVVDAGDAIIHIFRPEVREFYDLEKMWFTIVPNNKNSQTRPLLA